MSYTLLVQSSAPKGYWKLNGTASGVVGASASITGSAANAFTVPPLTANSASAMIFRQNGASVSISNTYDAFYKNTESKTLTFEYWFSFTGNMLGQGYPGSVTASSQPYVSNKLNIIQIMNGATQIGSIYYDYNRNTFRYNINGAGNTEAYYPVRNLNTNFYIVATYSNKKLSLIVNGDDGVQGSLLDTSIFPTKASNVTFQINPNSINQASQEFVVSDLAIYDYPLNKDQMRRRVVLAYNPDKPTAITGTIETSYFDLTEKDYHLALSRSIVGQDFGYNTIYENNLSVDGAEGIFPKRISGFINSDQTYGASVAITASGLQSNASAAAQMADFGRIFSSEPFVTITGQVTMTSASGGTVFEVANAISRQGSVYVTAASNGFFVYTYDPVASSTAFAASVSTSLSASNSYNLGVSFSKETFYVYGNGVTGSGTVPGFAITSAALLNAGNVANSPSANSLLIKNLGINNSRQTTFSGYDFTENKMFMARFTSDLSISQVSTWVTNVPLSVFSTDIVGSKVWWEGMDNILVQTSQNGQSWTTIGLGDQLPGVNYRQLNQDLLLKVVTPFEYATELSNQSLNSLQISLYRDLSFLSSDGLFQILPQSDISASHAYNIARYADPILQRPSRFGLYFNKYSGSVGGFATIVPTSSAALPYAIEMWVKFDSFPYTTNYLIEGDTSNTHPVLYASANKLVYSSSATPTLYVNGASVASNAFTASAGEFYHLIFDFGAPLSPNASVYLNSKATSTASTHSHGCYGFVNLWNSAMSASAASARYQHFVANNISAVIDSNSNLWQPNWQSTSVNSASGFKIG